MYSAAVWSALVIEIEHLPPNTVPVGFNGLVDALLFEDASLHLVEEFLLRERTSLPSKLVVVFLSLGEAGVALAGQHINVFLEDLIVEVVVFDFFEEAHEGVFEVGSTLLNVDEGPADHH